MEREIEGKVLSEEEILEWKKDPSSLTPSWQGPSSSLPKEKGAVGTASDADGGSNATAEGGQQGGTASASVKAKI